MEAVVMNYRRGRHHQHMSQVILKISENADEAKKVIGKTVSWSSPAGKVLKGKVSALHGRKGAVRAIFAEAGLPGQALGQKVKVE